MYDRILQRKWSMLKEPYFLKKDKRLYFENRLCVPQGNLRNNIMHDNIESLLGGHRGENKTFTLIQRHFYGRLKEMTLKSMLTHVNVVKNPNRLTKKG